MTGFVLDASALICLIRAEPGAERVADLLATDAATISSVNASEVYTKLLDHEYPPEAIDAITGVFGSISLHLKGLKPALLVCCEPRRA